MPSFENYAPTQPPKQSYRRRSGRISRNSSLVKLSRAHSRSQAVNIVQRRTSPRVPPEILDRIVLLAIGSACLFSSIASFSLASSNFRQIAFRRFFQRLYIKTSAHWSSLFVLLNKVTMYCLRPAEAGYLWVKSIRIKSTILAPTSEYLDSFVNLRSLSIDFSSDGLATQHTCVKRIMDRLFPFCLESLTLTSLSRIDTPLLKIISTRFPRLMNLSLSCTELLDINCCWGCLADSASSIMHSPIPDMFPTSKDLAIAFAEALRPLTNLARLHLGIFLSPESYFTSHIDHEESEEELFGPEFCTTCRDDCAHEDSPDAVRRREREASVIIAKMLKRLVSVGWSSFFPSHCLCEDEDVDTERATMVCIWRGDGKIRARSRPW